MKKVPETEKKVKTEDCQEPNQGGEETFLSWTLPMVDKHGGEYEQEYVQELTSSFANLEKKQLGKEVKKPNRFLIEVKLVNKNESLRTETYRTPFGMFSTKQDKFQRFFDLGLTWGKKRISAQEWLVLTRCVSFYEVDSDPDEDEEMF